MPEPRPIHDAEILAVGSELLVGETRDTNSGDLARALTELGVEVLRSSQLPDDLGVVSEALAAALTRADLVVTSGGLGPTPDDLTREAVAAVLGLEPEVDPDLARWLEQLWARRGLPFPASNIKQAWLIPGAEALPNPNGTAPGWWLDTSDAVIVALPGPPRELLPMWSAEVLPRLRARGLGLDRVAETLHLTGIGESALADLLGDELLRGTRPHVATYARMDAVDVRVWATGDGDGDARSIVAQGVSIVERLVGPHVFARDQAGWREALGAAVGQRRVAAVEVGTAGELAAILGAAPWLASAQHLAPGHPRLSRDGRPDVAALASEARAGAGVAIGLAVAAHESGDDMRAHIAVDLGGHVSEASLGVFRGGDIGRRRAATAACAELWKQLRQT